MLERQQVVRRYKALARQSGSCSTEELAWLHDLPPFFCRVILQQQTGNFRFQSLDHAFTGRIVPGGERYRNIFLSYDGLPQRHYRRLPLTGHVPVKAPGLYRWIKLALEELRTKDNARFTFIESWCSMIVWLMGDLENPPETELTSVALPALPHCTFLTNKAIQHIPPNIIIPAVTMYGLQENLFHEALHQQLSATLTFEDILANGNQPLKLVYIPWRQTRWPIDRALHAAWVYSKVLDMRRAEIEIGPEGGAAVRQTLIKAVSEGDAALTHLILSLNEHRDVFSAKGRELLAMIHPMDA